MNFLLTHFIWVNLILLAKCIFSRKRRAGRFAGKGASVFVFLALVFLTAAQAAAAAQVFVPRAAFLSGLWAARGFEAGEDSRENAGKALRGGLVPEEVSDLSGPVTRREALRWMVHSLGLATEAEALSELPLTFQDLHELSSFERGCLAVATRMTPPLFREGPGFGPAHPLAPNEAQILLAALGQASRKLTLRTAFAPLPGMELEICREGTFSAVPKWRVYIDGFETRAEVDEAREFFAAQGFSMEVGNPNYEWRLSSGLFEDYARVRRLTALARNRGNSSRVLPSLRNTNLENQPFYWAMLVMDPARYRMEPIVSPLGMASLAPLSFMSRTSRAAINGGFFGISGRNRGWPIGLLRIGGALLNKPYKGRTNLGWSDDNRAAFGEVTWSGRVRLGDGGGVPVYALNQPIRDGVVLYNSYYGGLTPDRNPVTEILVENGQCVSVKTSGATSVKRGRYILAGYGTGAEVLARNFKPGDRVEVESSFNDGDSNWGSMDHIIQAGPYLIRNGEIRIEPEGFSTSILNLRHPRSVMGLTGKGQWFFFVGDGRDGTHSAGFTLREVAEILKARGVLYALNLDGGGSSQLMVGGRIINSPSEKKERPVSYGIGIMEREQAGLDEEYGNR